MVYRGSVKMLHEFLDKLNSLHPTIKFTMEHTIPYQKENSEIITCNCEKTPSLAFLDTSCEISENKIVVDLYRKPTDRNQYLLTSSCHPSHNLRHIM